MAESVSSASSIKYWERKLAHRKFYKRVGFIAAAVILCVLCALVLPLLVEVYILPYCIGLRSPCDIEVEFRISCDSVVNTKDITEKVCQASGCCWAKQNDSGYCYHRFPTCFQYTIQESNSTSQFDLRLNLCQEVNRTLLRSIANNIVLKATQWSKHHFQLQILESSLMGGTEEEQEGSPFKYPDYHAEINITDPEYEVEYNKSRRNVYESTKLFNLNVQRRGVNRRSLLNFKLGALAITEDVLELTTTLPSHNVYGLGLRTSKSLHHDIPSKWTMVSRISTKSNSQNWPGVHPFYVCLEADGMAHGILLATKSIIRVSTTTYPSITFQLLGAKLLEVHLFTGPSPPDVIKQMTAFLGRPKEPPLWALGFHICRHGIQTSYKIIQQLRNLKIPHESYCISSNFVPQSSIWQKSAKYITMWKLTQSLLKKQGQKFVIVLTPHIPKVQNNSSNYCPYCDALQHDALLGGRDKVINSHPIDPLPNTTYAMLDVFSRSYINWADRDLLSLYNLSQFSGIFLDQNSPTDLTKLWTLGKHAHLPAYKCKNNSVNFPFISIGSEPLFSDTMCMDTMHSGNISHIDVHNVYGLENAHVISEVLTCQRPNYHTFLASASTHHGSGRYGGHYGTNYGATWSMLQYALVHMSEMSLYGVPMYGSAICGAYGVVSYELCARWYQLMAFSPFMFTARRAGQAHADPYSLVQVRDVARLAIQLRYCMLDYVYTQLRLCTTTGHPFLRPLFLEFPNDRTTWRITKQFFFGPALMVAPAVTQGINEVDVYFPNAGFYDFFRYTYVPIQSENRWKSVVVTEYQMPTYLREGHIMVVRRPDITVALTQRNRVSLIVAARQHLVDSDSKENGILLAQGELCVNSDSSLSKHTSTTVKFNFWKEHVQFGSMYQCYLFKILTPDYADNIIAKKINISINKLIILGLPSKPTNIMVDNTCSVLDFSFTSKRKVLVMLNMSEQCNLTFTSTHLLHIETPLET